MGVCNLHWIASKRSPVLVIFEQDPKVMLIIGKSYTDDGRVFQAVETASEKAMGRHRYLASSRKIKQKDGMESVEGKEAKVPLRDYVRS